MKNLLLTALGLSFCFAASAQAAPMMVGGVDFDTDNAASTVLWAQGGVFSGLDENRREACIDVTDISSTVGANGVNCRADEVAGFTLGNGDAESVELDDNDPLTPDGPDVLAVHFDKVLANGDGYDLLIFESDNQADEPTLTILLNGLQLMGVSLGDFEFDDEDYHVWAFDFGDAPLELALGAALSAPIYVQTLRDGDGPDGRVIGSADIAAIVALNFIDDTPPPEVPLPAAAWLFLAGVAGFGFAGKKKRSA